MRGPAFFAKRTELIEDVVSQLDASSVKPAAVKDAGGDVRIVRQNVRDVYLSTTYQLTTMLTTGLKMAAVLGSMRWHLLDFGAPLLAYSDHPVVVWPADIAETRPFNTPTFGPLGAIEVRAPLSPDLAILMTWSDLPDSGGRTPANPEFADELNALVVAQTEQQWMHRPGKVPPVGLGRFTPLSRAFEPAYSLSTLAQSKRRATAADFLDRVRSKHFLGDIDIADIREDANN